MELLAAVWGYPSPENLLVLLMRSSQITDFRVGVQHEDLGTLSINNKPYCPTSVPGGDVTRPMELDLLAPKQRDWNKT